MDACMQFQESKTKTKTVKTKEVLADETSIIQTLFAVPMTCGGCEKDVSGALYKLDGISKVEANHKDQLVRVEGTGIG